MNRNLYEFFHNENVAGDNSTTINTEQIADVLFCLCNAVERGVLKQAAPEHIQINDEGNVSLTENAQNNIYYAAPEVILKGKTPDKNAGWFTLGLLCYFVVNGRMYYQDKGLDLVRLPEIYQEGKSLITIDVADDDRSVPSLLNRAMCEFTSWNPEERSLGAKTLLKAIAQFPSTATLNYVNGGRIVNTETVTIQPPNYVIPNGKEISDQNNETYLVFGQKKIPFRPGKHTYAIQVSSRNNQQYERYLFIKDSATAKMARLMKLDSGSTQKDVGFMRNHNKRFLFYVVTGDPVQKRTICQEEVYHVDIPADSNGGQAILRVTYDLSEGCKIVLFDQNGTNQISDNILQFNV